MNFGCHLSNMVVCDGEGEVRERYVRHEKVLMGVVCCGGWDGVVLMVKHRENKFG